MRSFFRQLNWYKNIYIYIYFFSSSIRMNWKNIIFDDKKISKSNFYKNKNYFNIYDIDVSKILISKKEPYGKKSSFKYFIGYNDYNDVIIPFLDFYKDILVYVILLATFC